MMMMMMMKYKNIGSTNKQKTEENPPLDQQRRLGFDIDMIGAREDGFGSTRSQTLE